LGLTHETCIHWPARAAGAAAIMTNNVSIAAAPAAASLTDIRVVPIALTAGALLRNRGSAATGAPMG
jgi:hypothetical protein